MAGGSNWFSRFWQELKRRKTDRVIVLYAAAAFGILQLIDVVSPSLAFPQWVMTMCIIIAAAGFPVVLVISWVFDITPVGIEKTRPLTEKQKQKAAREIRKWKSSTLISIIVITALIIYNIFENRIGATELRRMEKSIAVLPFDNYCVGEEYEFLGDAIPNAITTHLTISHSFNVLSFTTVSKYKGRDKPSVRDIGKIHNVNFVVEGSVEVAGDKVSINVQLIRTKTDYHVWAKEFTGDKNDLQAIRAEINLRIAEELKIALSPSEIKQIESKPTSNSEAYLNFISGNVVAENVFYYLILGNRYADSISFENAIKMYSRAIEFDPLFALAYAKRAITYSWGYYTGVFGTGTIEKCRDDAGKALAIDPGLTEAWIARGFYFYYCEQDYEEALKQFNKASEQDPDNWEPLFYMAMVYRRFGNWETSQALLRGVIRNLPRNALILTNIGLSFDYLRNYDSAVIFHQKAIEVMPNWSASYVNKMGSLLLKEGSTEKIKSVIDAATLATSDLMPLTRIYIDIYDGNYEAALLKAEKADISVFGNPGERALLFASIYSLLGEREPSEKSYRSALDLFKKQLAEEPDNYYAYAGLGISYAGLGNKIYAIEAGEIAVRMVNSDVMTKNDMLLNLARIYLMTGETDKAIRQIEYLLDTPSFVSVNYLKLDPEWRHLSGNPEFERILLKYSL